MKKTLQIANAIALVITIVINYLSNTGFFNGTTIARVSAEYPNLFTPAGYAFSIWALIYLSLIAFVIYQGRSLFGKPDDGDPLVSQIGGWFVLSCLANSAWVLAWVYELTGLSVLIMFALFFSLMKIIWRTNMEMTDPPLRIIATTWWPFCLYSGWISVALIADVAAWLTKVKFSGFSLSGEIWAIIMICLAGAIHLFMTWNRNMREFAMVGVWALVAVAIADLRQAPVVATTGFVVAGLLFISSSLHGFKNRLYSPFRKRGAGDPPYDPGYDRNRI